MVKQMGSLIEKIKTSQKLLTMNYILIYSFDVPRRLYVDNIYICISSTVCHLNIIP